MMSRKFYGGKVTTFFFLYDMLTRELYKHKVQRRKNQHGINQTKLCYISEKERKNLQFQLTKNTFLHTICLVLHAI
jgi:hypothetical protein